MQSGEVAFVKTVGGSKNDAANSVVKTSDGGYAILGYIRKVTTLILQTKQMKVSIFGY